MRAAYGLMDSPPFRISSPLGRWLDAPIARLFHILHPWRSATDSQRCQ